MDWKSTIAELQKRGLSQAQIATACRCGQATISDLFSGKTKQPSFTLGAALAKLSKAGEREIKRHGLATPATTAGA